MVGSTMVEIEEDVHARHRKEVRELMATTTALKKQATKGEKKKKKDILKQIEEMELELKEKHGRELAEISGGRAQQQQQQQQGNGLVEEDQVRNHAEEEEEEESDELTAEKLLAQLELEQAQAQEAPKLVQPTPSQGGPKRNRRKDKIAKREEAARKLVEEAAAEASTQPDVRKIELENIAALCKLHGLKEYDIIPDGHCLFASISDQLNLRHGIQRTVQELRTEAASHIRQNPDTFGPFLFDEETLLMREIGHYCEELENTAVWGGDMEILALSKVHDCCISVLFSGRSTHKVNEDGTKPELKLVYYKHSFGLGEHYNSLRDAVPAS